MQNFANKKKWGLSQILCQWFSKYFKKKEKCFFFQCCKYIRLYNLDPNKKVKYKVKGKERYFFKTKIEPKVLAERFYNCYTLVNQ